MSRSESKLAFSFIALCFLVVVMYFYQQGQIREVRKSIKKGVDTGIILRAKILKNSDSIIKILTHTAKK